MRKTYKFTGTFHTTHHGCDRRIGIEFTDDPDGDVIIEMTQTQFMRMAESVIWTMNTILPQMKAVEKDPIAGQPIVPLQPKDPLTPKEQEKFNSPLTTLENIHVARDRIVKELLTSMDTEQEKRLTSQPWQKVQEELGCNKFIAIKIVTALRKKKA